MILTRDDGRHGRALGTVGFVGSLLMHAAVVGIMLRYTARLPQVVWVDSIGSPTRQAYSPMRHPPLEMVNLVQG